MVTRTTLEEKILMVLGTSLVGGPRYNPPVSGMFPAVACLAEICRDLEMSSQLQLQQQHSAQWCCCCRVIILCILQGLTVSRWTLRCCPRINFGLSIKTSLNIHYWQQNKTVLWGPDVVFNQSLRVIFGLCWSLHPDVTSGVLHVTHPTLSWCDTESRIRKYSIIPQLVIFD